MFRLLGQSLPLEVLLAVLISIFAFACDITDAASYQPDNGARTLSHPSPKLVFPCYSSATTGLLMSRLARHYEFTLGGSVEIDAIQIDNTQQESASAILFDSMRNGGADFAFSTLVPTAKQKLEAPDLVHFPAAGVAFGAVYRLPMMQSPLILDLISIARIMTGNITRWNDDYIVQLNPKARLPSNPIQVVLIDEFAPYILYATKILRKLDSQFHDMIAESSLPTWPVHRYASYVSVTGVDGPSAFVSSNPYSFAISLLAHATLFNTQIAWMRNSAGAVIQPSFAALQNAFSDLATISSFETDSGSIVTDSSDSICNAPGVNSWPLVQQATFSFSYYFSRTTCRDKTELIKFLLFILNSDAIQNMLAAELYITFSTEEIDQGIGLRDFLMTKMMCEELPLNVHATASSIATNLGYATLSSTHTNVRKLLVTQYAASHPTADYEMVVMDEQVQLQQMLNNNQVDMGWIFPIAFRHLYPGVLEKYIAEGRFSFFPSETRGVVPTYSLDPQIENFMTAHNALPLVIDMETLAKVFIGDIISWLDPLIVAFNPLLSAAYATFPTVRTSIHVIVFGSGDPAMNPHSSLTNHMIIAMNHTKTFQNSGLTWRLPADWSAAIARIGAAGGEIEVAPSEDSMETQIKYHSGSIGYKLVISNITTPTTDFRIVKYVPRNDGSGKRDSVLVDPTPAAFKACADATVSDDSRSFGTLDMESVLDDTSILASHCWPIPILNTVVIPTDAGTTTSSSLTTDTDGTVIAAKDITSLCFHRKNVVEFLEWLNFDSSVNAPTQILGRQAFVFSEAYYDDFAQSLYDLKCGGEYILHLPSESWALAPQVYDFVLAAAACGFACCFVIGALVYKHRYRTLIRSSNYLLQSPSFCGVILLLVSTILFIQPSSNPICGAMSWSVTLGMSLILAPQLLKILKVYQAAKKKHTKYKLLKRVNPHSHFMLSSLHLYIIIAIVIAIDVAILITTHRATDNGGGSLLVNALTSITENQKIYNYYSCKPTSDTMPYALSLLISKLALFFIGSILAFKIRHVSTAFGESTKISWSLWNSSICFAIILPLVALTGGTYGDIYTFLISFLLLWISIGSLLLLFGYKAWLLMGEAWENFQRNAVSHMLSNSHRNSSHGNHSSFATTGSTTGSAFRTTGTASGGGSTLHSSKATTDKSFHFPRLDNVNLTISQMEKYIDALEKQLHQARRLRLGPNTSANKYEKFASNTASRDTSQPQSINPTTSSRPSLLGSPRSTTRAVSPTSKPSPVAFAPTTLLPVHRPTPFVPPQTSDVKPSTSEAARPRLTATTSSPSRPVRLSRHSSLDMTPSRNLFSANPVADSLTLANVTSKDSPSRPAVPLSPTFQRSKIGSRVTFSREISSTNTNPSGFHARQASAIVKLRSFDSQLSQLQSKTTTETTTDQTDASSTSITLAQSTLNPSPSPLALSRTTPNSIVEVSDSQIRKKVALNPYKSFSNTAASSPSSDDVIESLSPDSVVRGLDDSLPRSFGLDDPLPRSLDDDMRRSLEGALPRLIEDPTGQDHN